MLFYYIIIYIMYIVHRRRVFPPRFLTGLDARATNPLRGLHNITHANTASTEIFTFKNNKQMFN